MDQKLCHWLSSFLYHVFEFSQRSWSAETQLNGSHGKVVEVLSFQGNIRNGNAKTKRSQNYITIHPILNLWSHHLLWSLLTLNCIPSYFLFSECMIPPSPTSPSHKLGGPVELTHFPHHYPHAISSQSPKFCQGHSFFSSPPTTIFVQTPSHHWSNSLLRGLPASSLAPLYLFSRLISRMIFQKNKIGSCHFSA